MFTHVNMKNDFNKKLKVVSEIVFIMTFIKKKRMLCLCQHRETVAALTQFASAICSYFMFYFEKSQKDIKPLL